MAGSEMVDVDTGLECWTVCDDGRLVWLHWTVHGWWRGGANEQGGISRWIRPGGGRIAGRKFKHESAIQIVSPT